MTFESAVAAEAAEAVVVEDSRGPQRNSTQTLYGRGFAILRWVAEKDQKEVVDMPLVIADWEVIAGHSKVAATFVEEGIWAVLGFANSIVVAAEDVVEVEKQGTGFLDSGGIAWMEVAPAPV